MQAQVGRTKPASSLAIVRPVLHELSELREQHGTARIVGAIPPGNKALCTLVDLVDQRLRASRTGRSCDLLLTFSKGVPRLLISAMGVAVAYDGETGMRDFVDDFSDFQ